MNYESQEFKKKIAKKIVEESLKVKKGENFLISIADPFYFPFAQEVAKAAIEIESYPHLSISSDEIAIKKFNNSKEYLKRPSFIKPTLIEVMDVELNICFPKNPDFLKNIPPEKLAARSKSAKSYKDALYKRNKDRANYRTSSFLYPTPQGAKKYNIPYADYCKTIWEAIDTDYNAMTKRGKKIAKALQEGGEVRITCNNGTDLSFNLDKNRKVYVDDGVMDQEDFEENVFLQNLPAGEVCCAPLENSANGTIIFQYNVFMGTPIHNLNMIFKDGKVIDYKAKKGIDIFKNVIGKCTGDKFTIAELGIGINPKVNKVIGDLAMDEKIFGTIHLAIGENRMMGGTNQSSIHQDFVLQKPTLIFNGKKLMEDGEYLI